MVKVLFKTHDGARENEVDIAEGVSLMSGAVKARVPGIEAACGGSLVCGTCHVYIAEPWRSALPAPSDMEAEMMEYGSYVEDGSRYACQIVVGPEHEGMVVTTPVSQH